MQTSASRRHCRFRMPHECPRTGNQPPNRAPAAPEPRTGAHYRLGLSPATPQPAESPDSPDSPPLRPLGSGRNLQLNHPRDFPSQTNPPQAPRSRACLFNYNPLCAMPHSHTTCCNLPQAPQASRLLRAASCCPLQVVACSESVPNILTPPESPRLPGSWGRPRQPHAAPAPLLPSCSHHGFHGRLRPPKP